MENQIDKNSYKIIKSIIDSNDVETLKEYITVNGLSVNINFSVNKSESDSLIFYAVRKSKLDIVKYLMTIDGIEIDKPNTNHTIAIFHAIAFNKEDIFDELIKHQRPGLKYAGEISLVNNSTQKMYPLTRATQARNLKMVKAIAEHSDNSFKLCGNSPYFYALSNKQTELALYLVQHKDFDPYVRAGGRNPYKFACEVGNRKVLRAILDLPQFDPSILWENKFKVQEKDNTKFNPLWWEPFEFSRGMSSERKISEIVFNHSKVDVNQKNESGKRLIDYHWEVDIQRIAFELLIENKKVDIYSLNSEGNNILEELILSFKNSSVLNHIYERRIKSLVDRIINEKPEIISKQCEHLASLNVSNVHKDYALGVLRYELLNQTIIKTPLQEKKMVTIKI